MPGFQNILVGVDFTKSNQTGMATLDSVAEYAVEQALWLARQSNAPLTLFSASERESAALALGVLVRQAREQGVKARAIQVPGQGWREIVRQVQRDQHDLVVVGTHDPQGLRRLLLGSNASKLVHECACPVWVSKPGLQAVPRNILVTTNLSPLSDKVVRVGIWLGNLARAYTHVVDVVAFPLDRIRSPHPGDCGATRYYTRVRTETAQALHAQVEQSELHSPAPTVTIHVLDGDGTPDHAIVKFVQEYCIDLVVLGTAARPGLPGVLLGNTVERLLPALPSSVVIIKPADFDG